MTTDPPRRALLPCGHLWVEGGPDAVDAGFAVVDVEGAWMVAEAGPSRCAECARREPRAFGMTWDEAWAEVERRLAARPNL